MTVVSAVAVAVAGTSWLLGSDFIPMKMETTTQLWAEQCMVTNVGIRVVFVTFSVGPACHVSEPKATHGLVRPLLFGTS